VLEYDGTRFHGFQRQPGARTVQETLEEKLAGVCGHPVAAIGAGRTDAGVHATGQVIHFDTTGRIPAARIAGAVNPRLGTEACLRHVEETDAGFHARFGAVSRTYEYYVSRIWPSPVLARYVLYDGTLLEDARERMDAALPLLLGTRDFAAFAAAGWEGRTTTRTVTEAGWEERGALLRFRITADGFLRSMVRRITGLLLEIGRGRLSGEAVAAALVGERVHAPAVTAPAHGLFLTGVCYGDGYPSRGPKSPEFWRLETAKTRSQI